MAALSIEGRCAIVVLIAGATGFLGSRIAVALANAGHDVICAVRDPGRTLDLPGRRVRADFAHDAVGDWVPRLNGVDVVINAVGILREQGGQRFDTLHVSGPRALFEACVATGVRRVIQISALGADAEARSRYHLSKRAGDEFLLTLPLAATVVQPSLVYGPGGASARLFTALASLPLIPLPGDGQQPVQPVHVDDAVAAVVALVASERFAGERVALVGPSALPFRAFLGALRQTLGLGRPRFLPVPMPLVRLGAKVADRTPLGLLDSETLQMLERGNTGPPEAMIGLLGGPPRPAEAFVTPYERQGAGALARLAWLLPVLRWSIAAVWIVTGIVSLGVYPVAESYALLARVGITGWAAPIALYGAALLDLAFGIGTLVMKRRRPLWLAQMALILGYTILITLHLPEYWLHPYGPILKNLPLLAALWLLFTFEER